MTPLWKRDLRAIRPLLIVVAILAVTILGCMVHEAYG
jgi:hypothetical protein